MEKIRTETPKEINEIVDEAIDFINFLVQTRKLDVENILVISSGILIKTSYLMIKKDSRREFILKVAKNLDENYKKMDEANGI